ncbi:MAG TPA: dihydroneopterin aldolase [Oligoflexia bacterium]|nr:dihydroneopterin aldolase [Oligoflexia bacterium]HMR25410.1 dihydroneopterin aldolase [Oligoflexia bacterium]
MLSQSSSCLTLHDFHFWVHLGDSEQERFHAQKVSATVKIAFTNNPLAEQTDNLDDTVCYLKLCQALQADVDQNHYELIEKLCRSFFNIVSQHIPKHCKAQVKLLKLTPPIKNSYNNGVSYTCGDWID